MSDLFRETAAGQLLRFVTRNRVLKYPEELPDFKLPDVWISLLNTGEDRRSSSATRAGVMQRSRSAVSNTSSSTTEEEDVETAAASTDDTAAAAGDEIKATADPEKGEIAKTESRKQKKAAKKEEPDALPYDAEGRNSENELGLTRSKSREETVPYTQDRLEVDELHNIEKSKSIPIVPRKTKDGAILVDWYYSDDAANPQNWSNGKRLIVASIICLYTFVVYVSSAIYTSSEEGVMQEYGVGYTKAALGLSIFVLGYGLGPLIFSPLSEIPSIGRNPVYIVTMFLFVIISIPTAVPHNYAGLMVLRFLQGFFGSPCLASGAASLADMYSLLNLGYGLIAWTSAAYCGPALGPLLSGFAVPVKGWKWSLLEIVWAAAPTFILMFMLMPETSQPNILLRRAKRLRKLTGSERFMSQSEIDQRNLKSSEVLISALIKPLEITIKDPAILFVQIYTAIIYGIYYSFFEVFPLVYPVYYGMNMGQIGLVFLCILVACLIGVAIYMSYLYFYMIPRIKSSGMPQQEIRLVPALFASFGPTVGLFIFAWTADPRFPWIAPTIGITVYGASVFIVMQCIFTYVPLSYPQYAASLFAGNDFARSALACGSILFARPLFVNLGIGRGVSLLGGLSVIGIVGIWLLYFYGARLRRMSKFAIHEGDY